MLSTVSCWSSSKKPWYNNTIFIIVSDHCAGSAGSVELPVTGYHIPMLIFAPGILKQPAIVDRLMAQIDIPPTILGMLNFSYKSKFMGQDIFNLPAGKKKPLSVLTRDLALYRIIG